MLSLSVVTTKKEDSCSALSEESLTLRSAGQRREAARHGQQLEQLIQEVQYVRTDYRLGGDALQRHPHEQTGALGESSASAG